MERRGKRLVIIIFQGNEMSFGPGKDSGQALQEEVRKNAWSFRGLDPPNRAEEIYRETCAGTMYIYYADAFGNYWYNTDRQIAFEKEMQEARKKRKKKGWRC